MQYLPMTSFPDIMVDFLFWEKKKHKIRTENAVGVLKVVGVRKQHMDEGTSVESPGSKSDRAQMGLKAALR